MEVNLWKNMKYCENCKNLCELSACHVCGNTKLRDVENNDFCFLLECEKMTGEFLNGMFENNDIPCCLVPSGNGVRTYFALKLENYKIFVPYQYYYKAFEIVNTLSENSSEKIRMDLLENFNKWHLNEKVKTKKFLKKAKVYSVEELFDCVKHIVLVSKDITNQGRITGCLHGGEYIFIKAQEGFAFFNSATYELIDIKINLSKK